jgi:hypothetical protein
MNRDCVSGLMFVVVFLMGILFCLQGLFTVVTGRTSAFYGWWPKRKEFQQHRITVGSVLRGSPFVAAGFFLLYQALRAFAALWQGVPITVTSPMESETPAQPSPIMKALFTLGAMSFVIYGVLLIVRPRQTTAHIVGRDSDEAQMMLTHPSFPLFARIIGVLFVFLGVNLILVTF